MDLLPDSLYSLCAEVAGPVDFSVRAGSVPSVISGARTEPIRSSLCLVECGRLLLDSSPVPRAALVSGAGSGGAGQDVTVKAGAPSRAAVVLAANAELDASKSQRTAETTAAGPRSAAPLRSSTFDRLAAAGPSGTLHCCWTLALLHCNNRRPLPPDHHRSRILHGIATSKH